MGLRVRSRDPRGRGRRGGGGGSAAVHPVEEHVSLRRRATPSDGRVSLRVGRELVEQLVVPLLELLLVELVVISAVVVPARVVGRVAILAEVASGKARVVSDGRLGRRERGEVALTDGVVGVRRGAHVGSIEALSFRLTEIVRSEPAESTLARETSEQSRVQRSGASAASEVTGLESEQRLQRLRVEPRKSTQPSRSRSRTSAEPADASQSAKRSLSSEAVECSKTSEPSPSGSDATSSSEAGRRRRCGQLPEQVAVRGPEPAETLKGETELSGLSGREAVDARQRTETEAELGCLRGGLGCFV